jgi:hypothetical protein
LFTGAGVGAFAYGDSSGNRYGGTYGLNDDQIFKGVGQFPPFIPNFFNYEDDFFPDYFNNLQYLLRE